MNDRNNLTFLTIVKMQIKTFQTERNCSANAHTMQSKNNLNNNFIHEFLCTIFDLKCTQNKYSVRQPADKIFRKKLFFRSFLQI